MIDKVLAAILPAGKWYHTIGNIVIAEQMTDERSHYENQIAVELLQSDSRKHEVL